MRWTLPQVVLVGLFLLARPSYSQESWLLWRPMFKSSSEAEESYSDVKWTPITPLPTPQAQTLVTPPRNHNNNNLQLAAQPRSDSEAEGGYQYAHNGEPFPNFPPGRIPFRQADSLAATQSDNSDTKNKYQRPSIPLLPTKRPQTQTHVLVRKRPKAKLQNGGGGNATGKGKRRKKKKKQTWRAVRNKYNPRKKRQRGQASRPLPTITSGLSSIRIESGGQVFTGTVQDKFPLGDSFEETTSARDAFSPSPVEQTTEFVNPAQSTEQQVQDATEEDYIATSTLDTIITTAQLEEEELHSVIEDTTTSR